MKQYPLHIVVFAIVSVLVIGFVVAGCLGYTGPSAWGPGGAISNTVCGYFVVAAALANKK